MLDAAAPRCCLALGKVRFERWKHAWVVSSRQFPMQPFISGRSQEGFGDKTRQNPHVSILYKHLALCPRSNVPGTYPRPRARCSRHQASAQKENPLHLVTRACQRAIDMLGSGSKTGVAARYEGGEQRSDDVDDLRGPLYGLQGAVPLYRHTVARGFSNDRDILPRLIHIVLVLLEQSRDSIHQIETGAGHPIPAQVP